MDKSLSSHYRTSQSFRGRVIATTGNLRDNVETQMFNARSTFIQNLNNRRGQIALFVALIFQILFLFFAMVINVGLLVHHKVNLQNSVDLAAYYGAMRQAENMNAIAHINYQIRQSWKLLAWRYRMLGSAGEWERHPFKKPLKAIQGPTDDIVSTSDSVSRNLQEAPAFCITYIPFKPMPPGENTCRYMASYTKVMLWQDVPVIAFHQAFSKSISNASDVMRSSATERCRVFGSYNYFMLGKFIVSFNLDQRDRMNMIASLSRASSMAKDDFYDLDGQKASVGIENTFLNNLTPPNKAGNPKMQVFNSLGTDACNASGQAPDQPAKWLSAVRIYPGFRYTDTQCDGYNIKTDPKELTGHASSFPYHLDSVNALKGPITELANFIGYRSNLNDNYNFSIGVEKNPWCMAYVGVSATTSPKIPFSPFGTITLKARAFYKPFGGRIGPWYNQNWNRGSGFSEGGPKTDPLLPPRVTDTSLLSSISTDTANNAIRAANFSRFPGDKYGLKTFRMLAYYGEAIYKLDPKWSSDPNPYGGNSIYEGDSAPNFAHWDHIPNRINEIGDLLSWDSVRDVPSAMRNLETAAILPDLFDMTYYSIEPDFYNNYYKKIKNGYLKGPGSTFTGSFRPDLGYHKDYKRGTYNFEEYNIISQFNVLKEPGFIVPVKDKFTFMSMDWMNVLTGWAPKGLLDYSLDTSKFGKCAAPVAADSSGGVVPTTGNCVVGGSTGYAVKMVSSNYLRSQDLKLGGENTGGGPLLNPPPDDSEF